MTKKKILVVLGGNSKEREISIKTGKACYQRKTSGVYCCFDPQKKSFFDIKKVNQIYFNALHGEEVKTVMPKVFFEYSKIPYTHSGVISSMNAMNKVISKNIYQK